jgi:DNA adenine methylase
MDRLSILRYPGSKWKMMPKIIPFIPHHEHYVSVFGGSAADILNKPKSRFETWNDIDGQLYNLFKVLRDGDAEELKRRLVCTPTACGRTYAEARAVLNVPITDPIKSAWAFLVVSHQSFTLAAPPVQQPANWRYARDHQRTPKWLLLPDSVDYVRRRFAAVQLFNHDWREMLDRLDTPETLFFVDPPYFPGTLNDFNPLYAHVMTVEDHLEMLDRLNAIEGKAIVCNYSCEPYEQKLAGWKRHTFGNRTGMGIVPKIHRKEIVWIKE